VPRLDARLALRAPDGHRLAYPRLLPTGAAAARPSGARRRPSQPRKAVVVPPQPGDLAARVQFVRPLHADYCAALRTTLGFTATTRQLNTRRSSVRFKNARACLSGWRTSHRSSASSARVGTRNV